MRPRVPPRPPRAIVRAALGLRAALRRAADAVVPAQYALFDRGTGVVRTQLLHAAARLGVADLLEEGPQDAAALARRTGADPDALGRALRALASDGVFALGADGRFANNRLSRALRSGAPGSMRAFLDYLGSRANLHAWADLDGTLASGEGAFERVHGATVWEWLERHPEEGRTFAEAMARLTELDAPAIAGGYPFGRFARVCDVAGGRGALLGEILARHPRPAGVLFDAPHVLERARAYLAARGVLGRVELRGGDLFGELPAGADAYVLKDVLHDWDDDACGRILAGCRRAARPGARLLAAEMVLEPAAAEAPAAVVDVMMMALCCGGRQRGRAELDRLLSRAGFRLERIAPLPSPFSLVEAVAVE